MKTLRRFWFQFDRSTELPPGVTIGCGATAFDRDDALAMLRERVFGSHDLPAPEIVVEDIDVSSLDVGHVRPNMGNPAIRGIWFPLGY